MKFNDGGAGGSIVRLLLSTLGMGGGSTDDCGAELASPGAYPEDRTVSAIPYRSERAAEAQP